MNGDAAPPDIGALVEAGRADEALALASARLAEAERTGDDAAVAAALLDEARAQIAHGDRDEAVMTVDAAISKARRGAGPRSPAYAAALELGGEIAAAAAMPATADARFRAAVELLEELGVVGEPLANALVHQGLFRLRQGDVLPAARSFTEVLERATPGSERWIAAALNELGFLALAGGRVAQARALGDRALEVLLELGRARRVEVADGMTLVGCAALAEGAPQVSDDFLAPAREIYAGCAGDVRARHGLATRRHGHALAALGRVEEARAALRAAIDLHREGTDERLEIEQELLDLAREG